MRVADYLSTGLRDIVRQPVRSLLTILALAISSSLFVALAALGLQTRTAITKQLGQDTSINSIVVTSNKTLGSGFFGSNVQVANQSGGKLDDGVVSSLQQIGGVASATPIVSIWEFKEFTVDDSNKPFVAKTNAVDPAEAGLFKLAAGEKFAAGETGHQVILGNGYAEALGYKANPSALVGKTIHITTQNAYRGEGSTIPRLTASKAEQTAFTQASTTLEATIVGVTDASLNDNLLFIPLGWAHQIQSPQNWSAGTIVTEDTINKNGYSSIAVQTKSGTDVKPVTSVIESMGYGTTSKQKQIDQINQLSTVMWIVLGSVALISLIGASLGIVNTMLMAVSEQKYAIGVWRACGATRSTIAGMFLLQALILGVVGGVIGSVVGMFASGYVNEKIANVLQAQGLEAISIAPPSLKLFIASVILTTFLALIAGLYPAYRAARKIDV